MRYDILFHLTTAEQFNKAKTSGKYEPEFLELEGSIPCSGGEHVEEVANRFFSGSENALLLVIDVSTLQSEVKYIQKGSGTHHPHIKGPINTDAIIDKLDIQPEENGSFEISFKSYS